MHKSPDYCNRQFPWVNSQGQALSAAVDMGCNLVFNEQMWPRMREYLEHIRTWLDGANATLAVLRIGFAQTGEFNYPISRSGDDWWPFGPNGSAFADYPPELGAYRPA